MKCRGYVIACVGASALLLGVATPVCASGGGAAALPEGVNYIAVQPPLIVNYGGPGKMRYIKAEFSIRAESSHDATEITHHLPLVRDRLINLLSLQSAEQITTAEGKEALRVLALAEINGAIHAIEAGKELVSSLHDEEQAAEEKHDDKQHAPENKAAAHGKPEHGAKADKSKKSHDSHGDGHAGEHAAGPATDLLFTNFVVQQ
jgi:flagellar protein FliL